MKKMKWLLSILLFGAQAFGVACSSQQAQTVAHREQMEKTQKEYKTPTNYEWRDRGYDPKTGNPITYDHKPRVEVVDAKAGKYAFKWIGYDGKEKTVIFQREDAIDVIVSASVSKTPDGRYLYSYEVQNLRSSGTYLTTLVIQNFAANVERVYGAILHGGNMSNAIYQFREGNWLGFHDTSDDVQINPGQTVKVQLTSSAPPGLVGCAAVGGPLAMEVPDEEMPSALENLLPGYEEWPHGYTIGPVDRLKTFSSQERVTYLLNNLPQFRKLGWMTDQALGRYEEYLKAGNLNPIFSRIDEDLKTEKITSEVFAIVQAMK
jgi:hypothetical protein